MSVTFMSSLSRQRMIQIDHDGFVLDLVNPRCDRFALGTLRREHRLHLLRLGRRLVFGNFLEHVWVRAVTVFAIPGRHSDRVGVRQREPESQNRKWNLDSSSMFLAAVRGGYEKIPKLSG
jgi:hypothetical protein